MSTSKPVAQPAEVNPRRPKRGSYKPKLELVPVAAVRSDASSEQLANQVKCFALSHDADDVGSRSWTRSTSLDGGARLATPGEHDE
jgi:hypothetical protein